MAVTNIPAPDNDVVQTWLKGTRDKKLVYSAKDKKWKIVPANKVTKGDVSYENYQQGEKTIGKESPYTPSRDEAGNIIPPPTAGAARYEAAVNPLKPFIDKYGLYVRTDEDGETYLADKTNKRYYLYYTSDGTLKIDYDYDKIKKAALDDLKKTKQLNNVFEELYKRKLISKQTYKLKSITANDFNRSFQYFIKEYSKSVVELNEPLKQPENFFKFMLGSIGDSNGGKADLPVRDINLQDRDVIEAIVRDVYSKTTDMSPDEQDAFIQEKTNFYMDKIKKGTLTTEKKVGGELVRTTTKGVTDTQIREEVSKEIKDKFPDVMKYKQNFDFLAFLDGLGATTV